MFGRRHGHARPSCRATRGVGRHFFIVPSDLAHNVVEGVVDVDTGFSRGFDESAMELAGKFFTLC